MGKRKSPVWHLVNDYVAVFMTTAKFAGVYSSYKHVNLAAVNKSHDSSIFFTEARVYRIYIEY